MVRPARLKYAHDLSLYVPSDIGQLRITDAEQVHAAQLTVAEYAGRQAMPSREVADLLDMLGIGRHDA